MMSSEIASDQKEYMRQDFVGQAVNGRVVIQKLRVFCVLYVNLQTHLFNFTEQLLFPSA